MNKIQKIVAKIFKIKAVVSFNDVTRCHDYYRDVDVDTVIFAVKKGLGGIREGQTLKLGVSHYGRGQKVSLLRRNDRGQFKLRTEIVIVIDDE